MPRKEGQKLKLLTLLEIFVRETDEKHPISVPRMVELLKERGIVAERKSVYDDIQTLNEMPATDWIVALPAARQASCSAWASALSFIFSPEAVKSESPSTTV